MHFRFTTRFERDYAKAGATIQQRFEKQLSLLMEHGPSYPSLRVHPYEAHGPDAMQGRVNLSWRFYFYVSGETYIIYHLTDHPKSAARGR